MSDFNEPIHLGDQPAHLCVQFLELVLERSLFGELLLVVLLEYLSKTICGLLFPAGQLVGMHTVLGSDLSDRSFFLENFEHDLGLMFGGEAFSHDS